MDIEQALNDVGTFGWWHLWVYSWIFFFVMSNAGINVAVVFMNEIPDFVCHNELSASRPAHWSFSDIQLASCPIGENDLPNCCKHFQQNYTQLVGLSNYTSFLEPNVTFVDLAECHGPWIWNYNAMSNTIVNQWSLICDRSMHIANMQLVFMLGFLVACCTFGFLADKFGRRKIFVLTGTVAGVLGVINAVVPNFYAFLVIRFFLGVFSSGAAQVSYVLGLELCNDRLRKVMGAIFFVFYSMGYVILCGIAYAVRDWRTMHIIVSAPSCVAIIFLWVLPESPRWLVCQKRYDEAKKTLEWAMRWNRKQGTVNLEQIEMQQDTLLPQQTTNDAAPKGKKPRSESNFLVIFCYPKLALRSINIFFNWIVNAMVYYGISLLITSFSGNIFANNAIAGALETPAYLMCFPLLLWARKKSLMVMLILSGISGLLYLAVPSNVGWAQLLLAFIGKLCITASFNLVYVVTLELYPTSMRGAALMVSSMMGRIGSIVAPYITLIAQTNKKLVAVPMVIFGAAALAAGVLTFFIPESQGQPLPESLDDVLNYPPKKKKQVDS